MKVDAIEDGVRFTVRVQPRASRNEVAGSHGDGIKIRLTAPPVDGAANSALIAFLAQTLGISKSSVRIVRGARSRTKVVEVTGIGPERLLRELG